MTLPRHPGRKNPFYSKTFRLGNQGGFNNQLTDTTKKFTYFVPRNEAWDEAGVDHPSAVKKLFMPQYHYHVSSISNPTLPYLQKSNPG